MTIDAGVAEASYRGLDPATAARMAPYARTLARDGAVHIPGALDAGDFATARAMFDWCRANPGPSRVDAPMKDSGPLQVDAYNAAGRSSHNARLLGSTIPAIAAAVLGLDELLFLGELIFVKEGAARSCSTPWHQDFDQPVDTFGLFGMWIAFEPLDKESCLNFVRGSHRGPAYNPIIPSDIHDSRELLYPGATHWPPFPDIDANRGNYEILSWDYEPGDIIIFNNMTIHGGGLIPAGGSRHALSLRFSAPDVKYTPRPPRRSEEYVVAAANSYLYEGLREGMTLSEGKYFSQIFDKRKATTASARGPVGASSAR